jgi:hypothetical protein
MKLPFSKQVQAIFGIIRIIINSYRRSYYSTLTSLIIYTHGDYVFSLVDIFRRNSISPSIAMSRKIIRRKTTSGTYQMSVEISFIHIINSSKLQV